MNIKLSLRHKIQLIITSVTVVIFLFVIGYMVIVEQRTALQNQTSLVESQTEKYGGQIKVDINEYFAIVRTLALAFKSYEYLPYQQYQVLVNNIYEHVFNGNPEIYKLWDSWEYSAIDSAWNKPTGRISNILTREDGSVNKVKEIKGLNGDSEYYAKNKILARELVSEIHTNSYFENEKELNMSVSFETPIIKNDKFIGLVGVDVTLNKFQEIISKIKVENLKGSYAFLISHEGKYVGHSRIERINTLININPVKTRDFDLINKINIGKPFSLVHQNKKKSFVSYYPIKIGRTDTYWCLGISVPQSSLQAVVKKNVYNLLIISIVGLLVIVLVIYLALRGVMSPIKAIIDQLKILEKGQINKNKELNIKTGDEIQKMAETLDQMGSQLRKKNAFAKELGAGNLDYNYELSSKDDELGISLIEMQKNLIEAQKDEKKRQEDDEINDFLSKAITQTGDLFRKHNQNIKELTFTTLQYLIDCIEAVQGAVYIKKEQSGEIYYELISAIAYGRDKLLDKKIKEEEGLVGRCGYEGLTIYLTEIPEDYIDIKSGLGGANPQVILLVLLKSETEILGVIELILFKEIRDYEISMVEKVSENLATTIGNVSVNQRTEQLLLQSQRQAEDLARQEQEMRQNIEEMKATQEESQKRNVEIEALHEAVNEIAYLAEFDMEGRLIDMNKNLEILLGTPKDQLIGKKQEVFLDSFNQNQFNEMWKQLRNGEKVTKEQLIKTEMLEVHLLETYKPIFNMDGEPYKILNIAVDITKSKKK